jgi:hypothetical protein
MYVLRFIDDRDISKSMTLTSKVFQSKDEKVIEAIIENVCKNNGFDYNGMTFKKKKDCYIIDFGYKDKHFFLAPETKEELKERLKRENEQINKQ